jgi:hypothetical protein
MYSTTISRIETLNQNSLSIVVNFEDETRRRTNTILQLYAQFIHSVQRAYSAWHLLKYRKEQLCAEYRMLHNEELLLRYL